MTPPVSPGRARAARLHSRQRTRQSAHHGQELIEAFRAQELWLVLRRHPVQLALLCAGARWRCDKTTTRWSATRWSAAFVTPMPMRPWCWSLRWSSVPRKVRALKDFFADFFDKPASSNEARALARETIDALKELEINWRTAWPEGNCRSWACSRPCWATLKDIASKNPNWFLTELGRAEDALLGHQGKHPRSAASFREQPATRHLRASTGVGGRAGRQLRLCGGFRS